MPAARKAWFEEAVQRSGRSSTNNFLSDDRRYSVRELGTNVARAMATNAQKGHVWEEFSSETYKQLPPAGNITGLYNPRKPDEPISVNVAQGGYYRTPSLVSMWATAPYLHNNALGTYVKDPSVAGRMVGLQRRGREAAVAGEAARRAVDDRHQHAERAEGRPGATSRSRFRRARRST